MRTGHPDSHRRETEGDYGQEVRARYRARELQHDSQLFHAYLEVEAGLREKGGRVERVVLEVDLKRGSQEFLQQHNRGRKDSDGRPDREQHEIADWARRRELPYLDDQVHFPDFRIEYELDGLDRHDVEVITNAPEVGTRPRVRGAGFTCVALRGEAAPRARITSARLGVVMTNMRDSVTAPDVEAIEAFGFTERQARFLVTVMVYSGAFLERQVLRLRGMAHGQKTHDFIII